jgi:hypothetical protein
MRPFRVLLPPYSPDGHERINRLGPMPRSDPPPEISTVACPILRDPPGFLELYLCHYLSTDSMKCRPKGSVRDFSMRNCFQSCYHARLIA